MRLSSKAIEEFKQIYQEEFGEELSDAQAQETALRVLRIFRLLLRPLPHVPEHNPQLHKEETSFDKSPTARTMKEGST
jgi:hypothetical protein